MPQSTKPSKKMCQPQRVLRRSLTAPASHAQLHRFEGSIDNSPNESQIEDKRDVKFMPCHTNQTQNQKLKIIFPNKERRKSYESLDVIDGRAITPVNTTARQRLLKVISKCLATILSIDFLSVFILNTDNLKLICSITGIYASPTIFSRRY